MLKRYFIEVRKLFSKSILVIKRLKYFIISLLFIIWIIFFDSNNIIGWVDNYRTVLLQEKQIEQYKEQIDQIDERLKELSSNKDSLERFAREQYYFHEPDEQIFILNKDK